MSTDGAASETSLRHNLHINNLNGISAVIAFSLVNPFFGIFALKVGASNIQVALLSSLPALMSMITIIPGALLVERSRGKKFLTGAFIGLSRLFIIGAAVVPLFPKVAQPAALVGMVSLMSLPGSIANVGWQGLIAEIIPHEWRGEAFAVRNCWMSFFGMAAVLAGGWVMDAMPFPRGYQLMFLLGFVAGVAEVYYFSRLRASRPLSATPIGRRGTGERPGGLAGRLRGELARVKAEKSLFQFLVASVGFHFAWMGAWPIFTVYKVDVLGASNLWMSIFAISSSIGSIVSYRWWARLADRRSNATVLFWTALGIASIPVTWVWVKSLAVGVVMDLYGGVIVAGLQLVLFNRLLEVATPERRTVDLAYFNTLVQAAATVSPMVGMWLYDTLGYQVTMAVFAGLRVLAAVGYLWSARSALGETAGQAAKSVLTPTQKAKLS